MKAIGIDLGTTSICGILIDTNTGVVLRSRTENSNSFIEGAYSWERIQQPEKIISMAIEILEDLMCEDVAAIGVTGQMHGIVYVDCRGKAVSPLYTWQDGRGNQTYKGTTYAKFLNSHSGYGLVTDFYNRENGIVPKEAVDFCTIQDYLVMSLCGLSKPKVHISDAASFGNFDLEKGYFTIDCGIEVEKGYALAGTYQGIPVSVAIGDNQASVFSTLASTESVLINIGTGSQVSIVSDEIVEAPGVETRPYFEDKFLVVGSALCGGRAYAVLKEFYKQILSYVTDITDCQVYDIMTNMLSKTNDSLDVDTRLEGTRVNDNLRGSINGISTTNFTPETLTHGFVEGMVRELFDLYKTMNVNRNGLVGSGNGLRKNGALKKCAQRMFNAPLQIPVHREEAAYGAALFALVSAGFFKNAAEVQKMIQFEE